MKFRSHIITLLVMGATFGVAQQTPLMSSHAPVPKTPAANKTTIAPKQIELAQKPAIRVNGTVLTELDVVREMYAIFPYAGQHNGFPKNMEADIRKGAVDMIVFEELLYQEAKRRGITIPASQVASAERKFRAQFPDKSSFGNYLKADCKGSMQVLREKVRRSLLIEKMVKKEVEQKSHVTLATTKVYYEKNPKQFEHGELFQFQTISIIPPENPTRQQQDEAKAKIRAAEKLARKTKTTAEFGALAEQISEDDWRTKGGDRGVLEAKNVPPEIANIARTLKPGQISSPVAVNRAWVVLRLVNYAPAGKSPFEKIKSKLQSELQKQKKQEIRSALNQKLRKNAKIEVL